MFLIWWIKVNHWSESYEPLSLRLIKKKKRERKKKPYFSVSIGGRFAQKCCWTFGRDCNIIFVHMNSLVLGSRWEMPTPPCIKFLSTQLDIIAGRSQCLHSSLAFVMVIPLVPSAYKTHATFECWSDIATDTFLNWLGNGAYLGQNCLRCNYISSLWPHT